MQAGLYADYTKLASDVREMQRKLAETRASAESPDGFIRVTVGGRGELLELELNPRIYRSIDSVALAADIKDTIQAAVESARLTAFELNRPFLPHDAQVSNIDLDFDPFLHQLDRQRKGQPA